MYTTTVADIATINKLLPFFANITETISPSVADIILLVENKISGNVIDAKTA